LCHADHQAQAPQAITQPVSLAVVGLGLANRIESRQFAGVMSQHRIQVTDVMDDLAAALHAPFSDKPQVLLVQVNSLQDTVLESIQALMQRQPFAQTIVLYHFAPDRVVQTMKLAGLTVRRNPISDSELAELLQSILFVDRERLAIKARSSLAANTRTTLCGAWRVSRPMSCANAPSMWPS
jgi:DNA-binding NtrC family response regulator